MKIVMPVYADDHAGQHPEYALLDLTPEIAAHYVRLMNNVGVAGALAGSDGLNVERYDDNVVFFNEPHPRPFDEDSANANDYIVVSDGYEPVETDNDSYDLPEKGIIHTEGESVRARPDSIQFFAMLKHAEYGDFSTNEIPRSVFEEAAGPIPESAPEETLRASIEKLIEQHGSYAVLHAAREHHGYAHTCWHEDDLEPHWTEAGLPDDDDMKGEFLQNNAERILDASVEAGNHAIEIMVSYFAAENRAKAAA